MELIAIKESMIVRYMEEDEPLKHVINLRPSLSDNYKNQKNMNMYNYLSIVFLHEAPISHLTPQCHWQQEGPTHHFNIQLSYTRSELFISCGPIWQHGRDVTTMTPNHFTLPRHGSMTMMPLPWHHQRTPHHLYNMSHLTIFIPNDFSYNGCRKV